MTDHSLLSTSSSAQNNCSFLDDSNCIPCLENGGTHLKLFNLSRCCSESLETINGQIVSFVRNVSLCPEIPGSEDNGDSTSFSIGIASLAPAIIGGLIAAGLLIGARFVWRCVANTRGRSAGSSARTQEIIEMESILPLGAQSTSRETEAVGGRGSLSEREPLAHTSTRSYGTRGGDGHSSCLTVSNPVYDEIHGSPRIGSTARSGIPNTSTSAVSERSRGTQNAEREYNELVPVRTVNYPRAARLLEDDSEDFRIFNELRAWGRGGRVKCSRKKKDTESMNEWAFETDGAY